MKQVEVEIMGRRYVLVCPEGGEARLNEAVRRVDEAMCRIRDAGKVRARDRIAVLAALNLAFELPPERTPAPQPATAADDTQQIGHQGTLQSLLERLDQTLQEDEGLHDAANFLK